jgi:hypothetical protein
MEAPPNLNATAQPIESNENKMSCRAATSVERSEMVWPSKPRLHASPRQLHRRSVAPRGLIRPERFRRELASVDVVEGDSRSTSLAGTRTYRENADFPRTAEAWKASYAQIRTQQKLLGMLGVVASAQSNPAIMDAPTRDTRWHQPIGGNRAAGEGSIASGKRHQRPEPCFSLRPSESSPVPVANCQIGDWF